MSGEIRKLPNCTVKVTAKWDQRIKLHGKKYYNINFNN